MIGFLDQSIGLRLSQSDRMLLRYLNHRLSQFDITTEQWAVLSKLTDEEGINQKLLAAKTEKDPATLLRILDILERKQLLERRQSSNDRRQSELYTSDKGKHLAVEVSAFIEQCFSDITQGLSENEISALATALEKLHSNLDALLKRERESTSPL